MNELYEFSFENKTTYYTSAHADFSSSGRVYKSAAISRSELVKESGGDDCTITMSLNLEPAPLFAAFNPASNIFARILDFDKVCLFYGRVNSVEFDLKRGVAKVKLSNLSGVIKSKIPVRTYGVSCSFDLFDEFCGCDKNAFEISFLGKQAEFKDNNTIIAHPLISSKPLGYFSGGYIEFASRRSYIVKSEQSELKLLFPVPNSAKDSLIHVFAGCDKTLSACRAKFNNEINYGGFPFVPMKNPMTQGFK